MKIAIEKIKSEIEYHKKMIRKSERRIKLLKWKIEKKKTKLPLRKKCEFCNEYFDNLKSLTNHERGHEEWKERAKLIRENLVRERQK